MGELVRAVDQRVVGDAETLAAVELDLPRSVVGQLETLAGELAGRQMAVVSVEGTAAAPPPRPGGSGAPAAPAAETDRKAELKQQALADSGVQALLDVFGAEIRDVEEIEGK